MWSYVCYTTLREFTESDSKWNDLLQRHFEERHVNVRLARWFFGLTMLFAAMGLCTSAQAQVVVEVGHPHHYRHHHHRHYRHHYDRR
jgi:hypothetical protein